ncbi:MAG: hypothetical protein LAO23_19575 [Acidobacteriia bacterium]|nr:hypothetical protein [Terriglobia bacterium]
MARTKVETNNEYLDASAADFSEAVQELLRQERAAYDVLKACKDKVLIAVRAEMPMPQGREVKRTAYTAWGQWQVIVGDVVAPKVQSTGRQSLADYLAGQAASGRRT